MNPTGVGRLQCAPQPHGASGGRVRVRAVEAMRGGRGQEGRALTGWVVPGTGGGSGSAPSEGMCAPGAVFLGCKLQLTLVFKTWHTGRRNGPGAVVLTWPSWRP